MQTASKCAECGQFTLSSHIVLLWFVWYNYVVGDWDVMVCYSILWLVTVVRCWQPSFSVIPVTSSQAVMIALSSCGTSELQPVSDKLSFLGRIFWIDLIKSVSNVHPSIHNKCLPFQWNLACRQRSMSDAWQKAVWPDPRWRSRALQSWKSGRFQKLSSPPFTMGACNWQHLLKLGHNKFDSAGFLIFILVIVSRDCEVGRNVSCEESTVSPTRANILLPNSLHINDVGDDIGWMVAFEIIWLCSITNLSMFLVN